MGRQQVTVFMVHESMVHHIVMEQESEILSKKEQTYKHLTQTMCYSPHWKVNVADLFGYSFKFNTRKEQVSVPNIKPFQLPKDDPVAIEDVPLTGPF